MALKTARFVSLLLVALILGLTFCHVMEIVGKMRLDGAAWLIVQHNLYVAFGAPIGAAIELGSILSTWLVVLLVRRRRPARALSLVAAVAVSLGFAVWVEAVAPMNTALSAWTPATLPPDWRAYRDQWELGHAAHAALSAVAFAALLVAILVETPAADRRA